MIRPGDQNGVLGPSILSSDGTVLYKLCCTVLYCTHCTTHTVLSVLYCTELYYTAHCTVPYRSVLNYTAHTVYCTVLYYTVLFHIQGSRVRVGTVSGVIGLGVVRRENAFLLPLLSVLKGRGRESDSERLSSSLGPGSAVAVAV